MPMLLFRVSDSVYRNPALEMRHFIFRNPQSAIRIRAQDTNTQKKAEGARSPLP